MTDTWIYESPDRGDVIYRRRAGSNQRELVSQGPIHKMMVRSTLWREIFEAAETDPVLQDMINKIEVYHHLKNSP